MFSLFTIATIGCQLPIGGESLVCARHDARYLPPEYHTPHEAIYHLHKARGDGVPEPGEPITIVSVGRNQTLGFRRDPERGFEAYAGDTRIALAEGKYAWIMSRRANSAVSRYHAIM